MRLYLNAGFGDPLGADTLRQIETLGFSGIRQDIPTGERTEELCRDLASSRLSPILLVAGGKMGVVSPGMRPQDIVELARHVAIHADRVGLFEREPPAAIELGNEPDIEKSRYRNRPDLFSEVVREGAAAIRTVSRRAVIVSGGIANTDERGLEYLRRAMAYGFPDDCVIGYHSYRTTTTPDRPHRGFRTRDAEFAALKDLAGSRPIWCTEVGWHTAPSTVAVISWLPFWRRRVQYTDAQVADFFEQEVEIHRRNGSDVFAWFQYNDGTNPHEYEHAFGIRRLNGEIKPVGQRVALVEQKLRPIDPAQRA